jgi:tetratricopeptide (TPR) repeat protein
VEAAKNLRHALELQPKLVPMRLRLEQYYPREEDFDSQVDALAERVSSKPAASADDYFLLGFMEFQRGRLEQAQAAFLQAARGLPKDDRVQMYLELTRPAAR